jgi:hypothetical protein
MVNHETSYPSQDFRRVPAKPGAHEVGAETVRSETLTHSQDRPSWRVQR